VDFKLCLCNNVWVAAGQALVAAITGEANRLLSLDLSSLEDGSQLPAREGRYNKLWTRQYTRTATSSYPGKPGG
jgi:hypothetical protein